MQNMVELSLLAGDVKDKFCDMLTMFGLTTTSRHIRSLILTWSQKKDVLSEVDTKTFWRFSFDNLNFLRKFANTFKLGGKVTGRMLNLLTGQITHRIFTPETKADEPSQCENVVNTNITKVTLDDFFMQEDTQESLVWKEYTESLYSTAMHRKNKSVTESMLETSFLQDLQTHHSSFTPPKPDNCSYARIDVAQSTDKIDIATYLINVKKDLNIGTDGFPNKLIELIVVGDQ
jgi:hypothetical protein